MYSCVECVYLSLSTILSPLDAPKSLTIRSNSSSSRLWLKSPRRRHFNIWQWDRERHPEDLKFLLHLVVYMRTNMYSIDEFVDFNSTFALTPFLTYIIPMPFFVICGTRHDSVTPITSSYSFPKRSRSPSIRRYDGLFSMIFWNALSYWTIRI